MNPEISLGSTPAFARPPVFSDEPFGNALARSSTENRWLVIDVVDASNPISWAAAYTTWRDTDLVAWLETYAVAVQVDERSDVEAAQTLGVTAEDAPLVILLRHGKQRLQIPGRQSSEALLRQLVRMDVADDNLALARRMLKNPERDMSDRDQLADALLRAELLDEALGHFDWLWQHMAEVDPEMGGVRVSFMARKIAELVWKLPAARARFAAHRDAAAATASTHSRAGLDACVDFVVLNDVLGDDERTLTWLDGLDAGQRRGLPELVVMVLLPLLYERERWADAGGLIRNPMEDLDEIIERAGMRGEAGPADLGAYKRHLIIEGRPAEAHAVRRLRSRGLHVDINAIYRSLTAAGRGEEAAALKDAALKYEDSPGMRAALR